MVRIKNQAPRRHKDYAAPAKERSKTDSEQTITASKSSSDWSTVSSPSAKKPSPPPVAPAAIPQSFEEFEAQFKDHLRGKFKEIEATIKRLMQVPEIAKLMMTVPGPADKSKRFESSYEVVRELITTLGVSAGALQKALAPTEILRFNHQAAMIHQGRLPLKMQVNENEEKIQEELQKLYTQAKDVAIRNNIPLEHIQLLYEDENYEMLDKLVTKDARCKNGIKVDIENNIIICVRARSKNGVKKEKKPYDPTRKGCSRKRKDDCKEPNCNWVQGKRCYPNKVQDPKN